jgi:hypothetical protein
MWLSAKKNRNECKNEGNRIMAVKGEVKELKKVNVEGEHQDKPTAIE